LFEKRLGKRFAKFYRCLEFKKKIQVLEFKNKAEISVRRLANIIQIQIHSSLL